MPKNALFHAGFFQILSRMTTPNRNIDNLCAKAMLLFQLIEKPKEIHSNLSQVQATLVIQKIGRAGFFLYFCFFSLFS